MKITYKELIIIFLIIYLSILYLLVKFSPEKECNVNNETNINKTKDLSVEEQVRRAEICHNAGLHARNQYHRGLQSIRIDNVYCVLDD